MEFRNPRILRHGNVAFPLPQQRTLSEKYDILSFNGESIYDFFDDLGARGGWEIGFLRSTQCCSQLPYVLLQLSHR